MRFACLVSVWIFCTVAWTSLDPCAAEDLIQPHEGIIRYQLSNLRVDKGITGDEIAFDYRRTREGSGRPRLVARTDQGASQILGLPIRIEESGTIRLRDMFARTRAILNRGRDDFGIEFYFVVDDDSAFGTARRYLVSNSVKHGTMSTVVKARPMTQQELAELERDRKAKLPPENVPAGYVRGTHETPLVPGAPLLFGSIGEWIPGVVVELRSSQYVRIKPDDANQIRTVKRQDWVAVSQQTLQQIRSNPGQFSVNIRTLPGGDLVLDDDMQTLDSAMNLLKGTPLLREQRGSWVDVYLISSDNVSVRALIRDQRGPRVEFIPLKELAIRKQTLADQSSDAAKTAFAANVSDFENRTAPLPGEGGAMAAKGLASGAMATGPITDTSIAEPTSKPELGPLRTWSDQTGKFKIQASLVKQDNGNVFLKSTDQRTISVPINQLSDADQTFLKEQSSEADNPFNNVVDSPAATGGGDYSRLMQPITKVGELRWGAKSLAISPENRFLLIGRKAASASLIELKTGRTLIDSDRMDHMGDISVCGFTPDGRHMVMGGYKGVFEVYRADSKGMLELKGQYPLHNKEITALSFSRDSAFVLSGDADKTARYWKIDTGQPIATIDGFDGKIKATCITPSGNQLLATDGKTLKAFAVDQEKIVAKMQVSRSHASGQAAALSPGRSHLGRRRWVQHPSLGFGQTSEVADDGGQGNQLEHVFRT